jgi:hypothetical protein
VRRHPTPVPVQLGVTQPAFPAASYVWTIIISRRALIG